MLSQLSYAPVCVVSTTSLLYHIVLILSIGFRKISQKLFFDFAARLGTRGSLNNGHYYSTLFSVCQGVFEKKFRFFSTFFIPRRQGEFRNRIRLGTQGFLVLPVYSSRPVCTVAGVIFIRGHTIFSKSKTSSNVSPVRYPSRTQASRRVISSACASLATRAAFS